MGALARSPHVLVSDAGEQLLACALCVLYKANADDVRDEALHAECKRIEWWCARSLCATWAAGRRRARRPA